MARTRNPSLQLVEAQIAYWMSNKGMTQAQALAEFHTRYPATSDELFFAAVQNAAEAARQAEIYGFVPMDERLVDYLGPQPGTAGFVDVKYNVCVPMGQLGYGYVTVTVQAALFQTRQEIEDQAYQDALAAANPYGSPRNDYYESCPDNPVIQVGGIFPSE